MKFFFFLTVTLLGWQIVCKTFLSKNISFWCFRDLTPVGKVWVTLRGRGAHMIMFQFVNVVFFWETAASESLAWNCNGGDVATWRGNASSNGEEDAASLNKEGMARGWRMTVIVDAASGVSILHLLQSKKEGASPALEAVNRDSRRWILKEFVGFVRLLMKGKRNCGVEE